MNNAEFSMPFNLVFAWTPLRAMSETHLDKNELTARVFTDLRKAFDTIYHDILLTKLVHYQIKGLANDWFCSYLKWRKQFVSIDNLASTIKEIVSGVPQGSVLGSLLFFIYVNDLHSCLKCSKAYHIAIPTQLSQKTFTRNICKVSKSWSEQTLNVAKSRQTF